MKWKAKPRPKEGDERWTIRFAFFPHLCNDGYVHWLCDLYVRQQFVSYWGEGDHWLSVEYSLTPPSFSEKAAYVR